MASAFAPQPPKAKRRKTKSAPVSVAAPRAARPMHVPYYNPARVPKMDKLEQGSQSGTKSADDTDAERDDIAVDPYSDNIPLGPQILTAPEAVTTQQKVSPGQLLTGAALLYFMFF